MHLSTHFNFEQFQQMTPLNGENIWEYILDRHAERIGVKRRKPALENLERIFVATFLGGCSGSTTGGIKAYRFLILFELLANGLRRLIYLVQRTRHLLCVGTRERAGLFLQTLRAQGLFLSQRKPGDPPQDRQQA